MVHRLLLLLTQDEVSMRRGKNSVCIVVDGHSTFHFSTQKVQLSDDESGHDHDHHGCDCDYANGKKSYFDP